MLIVNDRTQPAARLLLADDHPLIRQGIHAMLAGEPDLEIIAEAQNGQEALEMCRTLRPDLILMDLRMPEMDGLEATRMIKAECPQTSILILTVHDDPECVWEAIRAGAAGYALKITTPQELREAIRRVLRGELPFDQELAVRLLRRLANETYKKDEESTELAPRSSPEKHPESPLTELTESLRAPLTAREVEIVHLVAKGLTNRQIAQKLSVSRNTARNHVQNIITKLGVSDRTQAAVRAIELGLLSTNHKEEH